MKISALASGSSGNCFYIENENSGLRKNALLVDAGISCKRIEERLGEIKKSPDIIRAILVTHEHSDHIKGIDVFSRKFKVPIFATDKTASSHLICQEEELINNMKNDENLKIAGMNIEVLSKSHRAVDPVFFRITANNRKASVITDAGYCCNNIIDAVKSSNFLALESNHDEEMLINGPYPWHLKKWINGDNGHLSNKQASLCVMEHGKNKIKNIILSHISEHNNTPEKAIETWNYSMKQRTDLKPKMHISLRFSATPLFKV